MPSAVPPPSPPSSKGLCIRVLCLLGKDALRLQEDVCGGHRSRVIDRQ